jgi:phospholipid/cholesterol/gamma-HCH transport system ATP-binding protein
MSNENPAIRFKNVSLSFEKKKVLDKLSFEIQPYESTLLVGSSGAGKTTILKLILGLLEPDAGDIFIMGQDIALLEEDRMNQIRRKFGLVFQSGALFNSLTVEENIGFFLIENLNLSDEEVQKKVDEMLEFFELTDSRDSYPEELSGGMIKKVAIARAIISEPSILLYDEPVGGLDPVTAKKVTGLIDNLHTNYHHTTLVVTHEIYHYKDIIQRLMVLQEGTIVYDGKLDEAIFDHLKDK